jgi:hypothetical protein
VKPRYEGTVGTLLVFASYLLLSAAWSWPMARLDPSTMVARQFDLFPTVWLLARSPQTGFGLEHAASGWPLGESLARVDSYVLLGLAMTVGRLFDPRVFAALVGWLGPAIGALAAERCATHAFGVPRPASWVAGVVYGFGGVVATALLEGHVYHVFDPWLPLLLWAGWRATAPDGQLVHGFGAAAAWAMALATTAYAGVIGAVLLVMLALRGGVARLAAGLALVGLPAGIAYTFLFNAGSRWSDGQNGDPSLVLRMGTTSLGSLAGWSDAIDLRSHSIASPVGWTGLWLMLLAPVVLRKQKGWRTLLAIALLALVATMGRTIRIGLGGDAFWSPMALLVDVRGIENFRFPVRFAWLYTLCGGMVAAQVTAELLRRVHRAWFIPLFLLLAGDALVGTGLPWRLRRQEGDAPSAYAAAPADRAVLDLWAPAFDRSSGEVEMWSRALSCFYQAEHARPILEVCIGTSVDSPREVVNDWLTGALLRADADDAAIRTRLGRLGVGAIALHVDVFRPVDRLALVEALDRVFGDPAADTTDGGEHVSLWVVPAVEGADPAVAWAEIHARR